MSSEVRTCSMSLTGSGRCCVDACTSEATMAVLDGDFVEHVRCLRHVLQPDEVMLGAKAIQWAPDWAPETR